LDISETLQYHLLVVEKYLEEAEKNKLQKAESYLKGTIFPRKKE
jgi:hypothetical protein